MKEKTKNIIKTTTGLVTYVGINLFFGNVTATLITKTGMGLADGILTGIGANALSLYTASVVTDHDAEKIDEFFTALELAKKEAERSEADGNNTVSE